MAFRLLMDNDALLKLARYDLLEESICVLDCGKENVFVLAAAKYALLPNNNRLKRCREEESALRLEKFLNTSTTLQTDAVNSEYMDKLNIVPAIDAGEAVLFAAGASNPNSLVLTGDKRALLALSGSNQLQSISEELAGRILTLEQLILRLIKTHFVKVQENIRSKSDVDKALTIAFGVSAPSSLISVQEALSSYVTHLEKQTRELLIKL